MVGKIFRNVTQIFRNREAHFDQNLGGFSHYISQMLDSWLKPPRFAQVLRKMIGGTVW